MLEELRADVQDTLSELRELAHGIYPPLLRDRGLAEALQTAANRATLPTSVEADGIGRYAEGVETAVYFCCLEAMQNAGKHAGRRCRGHGQGQRRVTGSVRAGAALLRVRRRRRLRSCGGGHGHGFVNMRDRLGAIGGTLKVTSAAGLGHDCRREDPPGGDGRQHRSLKAGPSASIRVLAPPGGAVVTALFRPRTGVDNRRVGAISLRVRADLRRRWPAWLALAALIGVFAGGVIAISAGAERTNTAYPRLLAATRAPDLLVVDRMPDPSFATFSPAQLARTAPGVRVGASGLVRRPAPERPQRPGSDRQRRRQPLLHQEAAGRPASRPDSARRGRRELLGRRGRPHQSGRRPPAAAAACFRIDAGPRPPPGGRNRRRRRRVPARGGSRRRIPCRRLLPSCGRTAPSWRRSPATLLRLTHGAADLPAVQSEMSRMAGGKPAEEFLLATQGANTQRSIHLQSVALWVLASLLALAGILIVAQILARQSALESGGYRELRALGMTGRELWAVGLARVGLIGAAAAVVAGISAAAASPIFPLGLARIAEPHPGFHLDAATVLLGMVATFVAVMACGLWPTWRTARDAAPLDRLSRVERRRSPSYGRHPAAGGASVRRDRNRFRSGPDPRPVRRTGALDDHGGSHGRRRPHRRHRLFRQSHPPDEHPEAVRRHVGCTGDLAGG